MARAAINFSVYFLTSYSEKVIVSLWEKLLLCQAALTHRNKRNIKHNLT